MEITGLKLPNDPKYWASAILGQLGKKAPKLADKVVTTDIREADYKKGDLTGFIITAGGHVIVPVVIRNFRLKPFDVLFHDGKVKALTERTVEGLLFSPDFVNKTPINPQDLHTYTDISHLLTPPVTAPAGGGAVVRVNKAASVMGALKVAGDETKIKVANMLESNEEVLAACARLLPFDDMLDELKKMGGVPTQEHGNKDPTQERGNGTDEDLRGSLYARKQADGTFLVNGTIKKASELEEFKECEKSALLLDGEVLVVEDDTATEQEIVLLKNDYEVLKKPGVVLAVCADGDVLKGFFTPTVTTFNGKLTYKGLFVSEGGEWMCQESVVGRPLCQEALDTNTVCPNDRHGPEAGKYGTFVNIRTHLTVEPFLVVGVYGVSGAVLLNVSNGLGERIAIEYRGIESGAYGDCSLAVQDKEDGIQRISGKEVSKHFPANVVYRMGAAYRYVSLGKRVTGVRTPVEAVGRDMPLHPEGIISVKRSSDNSYLVGRNGGNSAELTKLGCRYELIRQGLSGKQAEEIVGIAPISFVLKGPGADVKSADTLGTRHPGALLEDPGLSGSVAGPLLTNQPGGSRGVLDQAPLEQAAKLNDMEILDSLLTIGMAEIDDRVKEYIASNTGDLRETIDKLGRLLLVVRSSEKVDLPEDILCELIQKLDKFVWKLNDFSD